MDISTKHLIKINFNHFTNINSSFVLLYVLLVLGLKYSKSATSLYYGLYNSSFVLLTYAYLNANELKNEFENILCSIPIHRKSIVKSKYLTSLILVFLYSVASFLLYYVFNILGIGERGGNLYSFDHFISTIVVPLIFLSIYLPINLYLGREKLVIFNTIIPVIIMLSPMFIKSFKVYYLFNYIINKYRLYVDNFWLNSIVSVFSVAIFYMSFTIGNYVYINKDV
ncbi:ABC-2 transporter permease [Hathewaya histolytica]|uniref:ABC-2 family transporter protein n=1 Tax=Hathewaya histolytica TaxID=1498 RepID=A0A4U9QZ53_HATHI|nr:ABC-2 transporter permease [Hathewaya histolytica]VTQ82843.1 ABC-2 family transporter protein [Hathewaya histolytica]